MKIGVDADPHLPGVRLIGGTLFSEQKCSPFCAIYHQLGAEISGLVDIVELKKKPTQSVGRK